MQIAEHFFHIEFLTNQDLATLTMDEGVAILLRSQTNPAENGGYTGTGQDTPLARDEVQPVDPTAVKLLIGEQVDAKADVSLSVVEPAEYLIVPPLGLNLKLL